jgi:hypothetical protein
MKEAQFATRLGDRCHPSFEDGTVAPHQEKSK